MKYAGWGFISIDYNFIKSIPMNWTYRRPFRRQQFVYDGTMTKQQSMNRPLTYRVSNTLSNLPIDAIRLELADYHPPSPPCPVHHHHHRSHPYRTTTTFDDRQSSLQRALSSIRSVSTFETDFVHQRVSTIRQYPSSDSLIAQQEIINDPLLAINNNEHEDLPPVVVESRTNDQPIQIEEQSSPSSSSQCRSCLMLMDIVDQQTEQIRQYNDQISQQADLLAKLARRLAGIEEGIDQHKSNS